MIPIRRMSFKIKQILLVGAYFLLGDIGACCLMKRDYSIAKKQADIQRAPRH